MNKGIDTTIKDAFEEKVICKTELTPFEYFKLGWKAANTVCSKTAYQELPEKTWEDVVNNKKG